MTAPADEAGASDRAFALLQELLPQHLLSRGMHRLARITTPVLRNATIRAVLRAYPQIDLSEAVEPDPFAYPSFNAFFTRALRPGLRPLEGGERDVASPVDGTLSQLGVILFMGKVSGAHLNPAVSLAFAARGDFPWRRVPGYAFLTVFALYLYGGGSLKGMAESQMLGIVIGTLSSIFVACPLLLWLGVSKQDLMPKARDEAALARRP